MTTRKRPQVSLTVNSLEDRNAPSGFIAPRLEMPAFSSSASMVELNPQPLPPRQAAFAHAIIIIGG